MSKDSITDDIRKIRHDLAAQFGNDLDAILADVRRREIMDGRTYVSLAPRRISCEPDEQGDAPELSSQSVLNGGSNPPSP